MWWQSSKWECWNLFKGDKVQSDMIWNLETKPSNCWKTITVRNLSPLKSSNLVTSNVVQETNFEHCNFKPITFLQILILKHNIVLHRSGRQAEFGFCFSFSLRLKKIWPEVENLVKLCVTSFELCVTSSLMNYSLGKNQIQEEHRFASARKIQMTSSNRILHD